MVSSKYSWGNTSIHFPIALLTRLILLCYNKKIMADPSDFLAIDNFLNDDSSSAGSNLRSSMSELDSSCATSGAESEESPSTASARYAFGNVEIDPPDDESKISASLFVDEVGPKMERRRMRRTPMTESV